MVDQRPDGSLLVQSPHPLGTYPEKMSEPLDFWARHASYRTFLAQREPKFGWRNVTYAEAQFFARRIGQAILNRDLSVERPVVILSENEIEHALVAIACMYAGVPFAPIPTEWSMDSPDFREIRYIFELLSPGLVYVSDGAKYKDAIQAMAPSGAELVVNVNTVAGATPFADLVNTEPEELLALVHSRVHADTVYKILFTPGSDGLPKGVIHTHRMWASNQEMARAYLQFLADEPPTIVTGFPWNRTFGGNADLLGLVINNGGTLYIDRGRPAPGTFDETIHALRLIAPTLYWNVPEAYEYLIPCLRADASLRKRFFSRLKMLYCSPSLRTELCDQLQELAIQESGERIVLLTGLAAAESASNALFGPREPAQGIELKLVPDGTGKYEVRMRGPNVTPGYWRRLNLTRQAFDEEGFYKA
ncbi:MAG TPA: AMP-binding protein, partial [Terriglobia bacterium]|nr:AMP-binding protein [Terriglobia bacterium]